MSGDNGHNETANGLDRGLPGSRYMRLKVEIEQEEKALEKKRRMLEDVKREERDMAIYELRQKIIMLGILPHELYPNEKKLPNGRADGRTDKSNRPVKYRYNGQTWSGMGKRPGWYAAAIAAGVTKEQMRVAST